MIFDLGPPWLLALVAGLAGGAFPLAIAMFNLRTRTPLGSASIAGFAMGVGYLAGTLGPLLGGWLYGTTGSWTLDDAARGLRGHARPHVHRWAHDGALGPLS